MSSSSPSCIAETVLLTLGRLCPPASLHILRCLLKMPVTAEKGRKRTPKAHTVGDLERDLSLHCYSADQQPGPLFYQWEGVESNTGTENLIYRLAHERDEWTAERISLLLQWLTSVAHRLALCVNTELPAEPLSAMVVPGLHIGCLAVVLWEASSETGGNAGHLAWRSELITEHLLHDIYLWYLTVCPQNPDMRRSLACLMCSLCALSPDLFARLLDWTEVSASIQCDSSQRMTRQFLLLF